MEDAKAGLVGSIVAEWARKWTMLKNGRESVEQMQMCL